MSGNAFKDQNVKRIKYEDYLKLMQIISKIFLNIKPLGSSQRFEGGYLWQTQGDIGDLDLAVKMEKQRILSIVKEHTIFKSSKVFGNTISTLVQMGNDCFHIDLMPSKNLEDESWIMTGGSPKIKGVMRNVLLCFLAMKKSEKETNENEKKKWTIAFPGGIGLSLDGEKVKERVTSPSIILSTLELNSSAWDIEATRTFEGLVEYVEWDLTLFEDFKSYSRSQWLYKKSPEVIDKALSFLDRQKINIL